MYNLAHEPAVDKVGGAWPHGALPRAHGDALRLRTSQGRVHHFGLSEFELEQREREIQSRAPSGQRSTPPQDRRRAPPSPPLTRSLRSVHVGEGVVWQRYRAGPDERIVGLTFDGAKLSGIECRQHPPALPPRHKGDDAEVTTRLGRQQLSVHMRQMSTKHEESKCDADLRLRNRRFLHSNQRILLHPQRTPLSPPPSSSSTSCSSTSSVSTLPFPPPPPPPPYRYDECLKKVAEVIDAELAECAEMLVVPAAPDEQMQARPAISPDLA